VAIAIELHHELVVQLVCQELAGDADVALAQLLDPVLERRVLALGQRHEAQQRIGHASACGQHDRLAGGRVGLDDRRDPRHAGRVRDTRSAELMDFPRFHD
jgi:hypothetical protein